MTLASEQPALDTDRNLLLDHLAEAFDVHPQVGSVFGGEGGSSFPLLRNIHESFCELTPGFPLPAGTRYLVQSIEPR